MSYLPCNLVSVKAMERDESGTEYSLETGFGTITKVDWPVEGKKNAEVHFDAEGLRLAVRGWANVEDRPELRQQITEALDSRARVAYRIEVHRDSKIDKTIPFDDVGKFDRFRRLEGLRIAGGAPERPVPNEPSAPSSMPSGGTQTDTWAYAAAVATVDLAYEVLHEAASSGRIPQVLPTQVKAVAAILLRVSDQVQAAVRDGKVDRNANSHTRARGAVRTALTYQPMPAPASIDEMGRWIARLAKTAVALMSQAVELAADTPDVDDSVGVLLASWADAVLPFPPGWSSLSEEQRAEVSAWATENGYSLVDMATEQRVDAYRRGESVPA